MNRLIWAVALAAFLALGGIVYQSAWLGPARSQTPAGSRPSQGVPVRVATVTQQPAPVRFDTIGTVQTIASVTVKSRIDAVIDKVQIRDGQYVAAGDVMFLLDGRAAQAQVDQAKANLARDQANYENAERDVGRYAPLVSKEFVSRQQYDTAVTAAKALQRSVQADQAALENATVQLSYYTIAAPIDGRVGMVAIKAGNSIKSNDLPLVTINQIKPIYVAFSLPQSNLPELRAAMAGGKVAVRVLPQGDKGAPVEGQVGFFDNAVDTNSGTINVRASFANDEQRLWPGEYVSVSVVVRLEPDAITVPPTAVQVGRDGNFVFVIKDDNTAEARPVTVNRIVDGVSVISKGLKPGEKVAVDGQLRLNDGVRVQIQPAAATATPGGAS
jgi:membrane fusion protein, multidrug efflux system